jgi:hypothetical protein
VKATRTKDGMGQGIRKGKGPGTAREEGKGKGKEISKGKGIVKQTPGEDDIACAVGLVL